MRPITTGDRPTITAQPGPLPDLAWIPIDQLVLDDTYQRPLLRGNWTQITKIASAFSWQRFGACQVAPLSGGRYAVIDGQHRAHAAQLCGIREVPCMVVKMTLAEQAAAFSAINGTVTKISLFHVYRAALAAREAWALDADRAVRDAGCTLMTYYTSHALKKPGQVFSIRLVADMVKSGEGSVVTTGLAAIRASGVSDMTDMYSGKILNPWFRALARNQRFLRLDLAGFLDDVDLVEMVDGFAAQARQIPGASRYSLAADQIATMLRARLTQDAA